MPAIDSQPAWQPSFTGNLRLLALAVVCWIAPAYAIEPTTPEDVLRLLVRANAEKDIATLSRHMAHDADVVGYTIGGRKYVGWQAFEREMQEEFKAVTRLEIPITELRMWQKGDVAWFSMELDYIRYIGTGASQARISLPLRETGVLEKRNGQWLLHVWHESSQRGPALTAVVPPESVASAKKISTTPEMPDLSGDWEIEEEDKAYRATLDKTGNGTYTHKGGTLKTTSYANRLWQGTWQQPENDREGGFEVLLSEDGKEANGIWWYSRVGDHKNIPPREHGGTYSWKRLTPPPAH
jgi:ketosteroid isomerase-like protein